MSRTFSTNIQYIISQIDDFEINFLVKLTLNQTYYFTTSEDDVDYNDNTYTANNTIFYLDSPEFSNILDRAPYKISLGMPDSIMTNEFLAGMTGGEVEVKLFFSKGNINYLDDEDVISVYKGTVDKPGFYYEEDSHFIEFEGASPIAQLDASNFIVTTKDSMKNINPNDTTFDNVFLNNEVQLSWGK